LKNVIEKLFDFICLKTKQNKTKTTRRKHKCERWTQHMVQQMHCAQRSCWLSGWDCSSHSVGKGDSRAGCTWALTLKSEAPLRENKVEEPCMLLSASKKAESKLLVYLIIINYFKGNILNSSFNLQELVKYFLVTWIEIRFVFCCLF
jgi:hypothetical protein